MAKSTPVEDCPTTRDDSAPQNSELVPYYVRACLLGIPAYLMGVHLWTWIWNVHTFIGGQADFRRFYASGYMLRTGDGRHLYDLATRFAVENRIVGPGPSLGFDHPAYETLLFAPFSYLHYKTAYLAFLALNVGVLGICFWLLQPWTRNLQRIYSWLPAAMFLAYLPVCAVLIQGQDSLILLMLLAITLHCLEKDYEFVGGLILAVGLFKLQILIPIAALFLLWKRWRFVTGFAISAGVMILVSLMLVGLSPNLEFIRTLVGISVHSGSVEDRLKYLLVPTLMPNIRGFVFGILNGHLPNSWIQGLTVLLSTAVFVWAAFAVRLRGQGDKLLVAILISGLVSYHLFMHDVVVLFLPLLIVINGFLFAENQGTIQQKFKLRAASLLFVAPVLLAWFASHFYFAVIPLLVLAFALVSSNRSNLSETSSTHPALELA